MVAILIPLISRDVGAGIMVGLITAIGLMIYEYIRTGKDRRERKQIEEKRRAIENEENEIKEKKSNLIFLKSRGILTSSEYELKIQQINNVELDKAIKLTEEYQQLKNLLNSEVLDQKEFEEKVQILKSQFIKSKPIQKEKVGLDDTIEDLGEVQTNPPDFYKRYFNNGLSRFEVKLYLSILFILFIGLPILGVVLNWIRNLNN